VLIEIAVDIGSIGENLDNDPDPDPDFDVDLARWCWSART
jgi:hypothetical protein